MASILNQVFVDLYLRESEEARFKKITLDSRVKVEYVSDLLDVVKSNYKDVLVGIDSSDLMLMIDDVHISSKTSFDDKIFFNGLGTSSTNTFIVRLRRGFFSLSCYNVHLNKIASVYFSILTYRYIIVVYNDIPFYFLIV